MQKLLTHCCLTVLAATLCGCPYSSPYPLDATATEPVRTQLLGSWNYISEVNKEQTIVTISQKTDTDYSIALSGSIAAFTSLSLKNLISGTGFTSTVDSNHFLNIFYNSRWYIVHLIEKNNKLSLLPLTEHFTNKIITNSIGLRTALSYHMKHRLMAAYDDIKLEEMQR